MLQQATHSPQAEVGGSDVQCRPVAEVAAGRVQHCGGKLRHGPPRRERRGGCGGNPGSQPQGHQHPVLWDCSVPTPTGDPGVLALGTPMSCSPEDPSVLPSWDPNVLPLRTPMFCAPGTPMSLPQGTPVSFPQGIPMSCLLGTPVSFPSGTPMLFSPGTPVSLSPGTPVSCSQGTPVSCSPGNANVLSPGDSSVLMPWDPNLLAPKGPQRPAPGDPDVLHPWDPHVLALEPRCPFPSVPNVLLPWDPSVLPPKGPQCPSPRGPQCSSLLPPRDPAVGGPLTSGGCRPQEGADELGDIEIGGVVEGVHVGPAAPQCHVPPQRQQPCGQTHSRRRVPWESVTPGMGMGTSPRGAPAVGLGLWGMVLP